MLVPDGTENGELPPNCVTAKLAVVHGSALVACGAFSDCIVTVKPVTVTLSSFGFENARLIRCEGAPGWSSPGALPLIVIASPSAETAAGRADAAPANRAASAEAATAVRSSRDKPRHFAVAKRAWLDDRAHRATPAVNRRRSTLPSNRLSITTVFLITLSLRPFSFE